MRRFATCTVGALTACALFAIPVAAWAQAHEQRSGPYTLRASTVRSESISAEAAKAQGIDRSPSRAVINVTVMRDGKTVPAQVAVHVRNLAGMRRAVPMRPTPENGYISYVGAYSLARGDVLDYNVTARPVGSAKPLSLHFRDNVRSQRTGAE